MPTVNAYFHHEADGRTLTVLLPVVKNRIAEKLSCRERSLEPAEVSIRLIHVPFPGMIAPLELEVLAHRYEERMPKADAFCREMRHFLLDHLLISDARVWLTLVELGHSWDSSGVGTARNSSSLSES